MRPFLTLLLVTAAVAAAEPKKKPPAEIPAGVGVERDVAYLTADRKELADLYFPKDLLQGARIPAVLVIHGGGFNDGDKGRSREINIATNVALHGYVAMSINYKLARVKGKATWPQCLHDAKTAVRWLRKNAERLQVDPERIGVIGCSAGGNMAAMLALTRPDDSLDPQEPYGEFSARVTCAVDFYGAVDLMNYHEMKMFAKTRAEAPELYRKASPVTYAHQNAAPLLMVHGTADETVPLSQSETLAAALTKARAEHELVVISGAPHTFDLQPKQRDLRPLVLGFLDQNLKSHNP